MINFQKRTLTKTGGAFVQEEEVDKAEELVGRVDKEV